MGNPTETMIRGQPQTPNPFLRSVSALKPLCPLWQISSDFLRGQTLPVTSVAKLFRMVTPSRLVIQPAHEREIHGHGQRAFPDECCGFLIGQDRDGVRRIEAVLAANNNRDDRERHHRFTIPPEAFISATREARRLDLDVLGFYHSHPNAPARPSQYDLEHAWPVYSYLIVSVLDRRADDMTCWVMRNDRTRFDEQTVTVAVT